MPTKTTSNYGVILGSSIVVQGKGIFRKVEVMVGDWNISDSFPTLELGGVDMILEESQLEEHDEDIGNERSWVLRECIALKGRTTVEELYDEEVVLTVENTVSSLLNKFEDVFE
ncbi:ty3-gypsy retroelement transposase [Cucumis melo var. makuwa]|uniref:Ty3-gypsy retroelement transposase n=1 Tax=Cucumis melo var. makuwa TaxID=1194695 RepID=A0A5D3DIN6_CUCMM|nr:ty3-gypsy retroelement transposase [Cucumis melo var. makuwa]TYK23109.1 ty3-gypsy retroelement transposase [Cucumis melo var. makuwa]